MLLIGNRFPLTQWNFPLCCPLQPPVHPQNLLHGVGGPCRANFKDSRKGNPVVGVKLHVQHWRQPIAWPTWNFVKGAREGEKIQGGIPHSLSEGMIYSFLPLPRAVSEGQCKLGWGWGAPLCLRKSLHGLPLVRLVS